MIVQEKLDGANVGVALLNDEIIPLTRAGYRAETSPFLLHHYFAAWVTKNQERFRAVLKEKERICGEWLLIAHGTKYDLPHEPFVVFDLMYQKHERAPYNEFIKRLDNQFIIPKLLSDKGPVSIALALSLLGKFGHHGATDKAEGVVWRVERNRLIDKNKGNIGGRKPVVDFLVKYVHPEKIDGKYLNGQTVMNNYSEN